MSIGNEIFRYLVGLQDADSIIPHFQYYLNTPDFVLSCDMIYDMPCTILHSKKEITMRNTYLLCITVDRFYPVNVIMDNLIITDVFMD